nr:GNAT family N-acetyltransferase [Saprospiraceae bacterium]
PTTLFPELELILLSQSSLPMNLVQLHSERLLLREWVVSDIPLIHHMLADPRVEPFHTFPSPLPLENIEKTLEATFADQSKKKRTHYGWSIIAKQDGAFMGEIGLEGAVERFKSAEIFYSIHPDYWGQGIATEAAKTVTHFVFADLKLHRLEAGVDIRNVGSIKVLEKIGMRREGLRRKILPMTDGWHDNYLYAMLKEDYFAENKRL